MTAKRTLGQPLSPREMQVLKLAGDGESAATTAALLRMSEHTVKQHRGHVLQKLGAANVAHAVAIGFRKGWLQ